MQKQLRDGLILRSLSEGYASDRERLPQLYADVISESDPQETKDAFIYWTRDLMSGHPTVTLDDIFVVVDPAHDDRVVSATLLIPQTWRYEDITLSVGRPELVATYAEYRGRGLVRALFEATHERSAALGHQLQVITGIANFYRQFGYTMAVDLWQHATLPLHTFEEPKPDYQPAYTLRPATVDDIPDLARWYDHHARERLLTESRSVDVWCYDIQGRHSASGHAADYQIIINAAGQGVGYAELGSFLWEKQIVNCNGMVVAGASYVETFGDVVRAIKQVATDKYGYCPALLAFSSGNHAALERLIDHSTGGLVRKRTYTWYLRVPEIIAFLRHITPVLERRLVGSGADHYTGDFKVGFFDLTGIRFQFERGRITDISYMTGPVGYDISFPWELFWNVVFGHHSYDDLRATLPDVSSGGKGVVLLDALFPKRKSWLKGLA